MTEPTPTMPLIRPIEAAHVLFHFGDDTGVGVEPSAFIFKLITAMRAADSENLTRLALGFPGYALAVRMMTFTGEQIATAQHIDTVRQLRAVAEKLRK